MPLETRLSNQAETLNHHATGRTRRPRHAASVPLMRHEEGPHDMYDPALPGRDAIGISGALSVVMSAPIEQVASIPNL